MPGAVAPDAKAQVWSHGAEAEWHALRSSADSISGIPSNLSMKCDSCRRALSRTDVDSVRFWGVSHTEKVLWITGLAIVAAQAVYYEATGDVFFGLLGGDSHP
jgi:hypothetical protein